MHDDIENRSIIPAYSVQSLQVQKSGKINYKESMLQASIFLNLSCNAIPRQISRKIASCKATITRCDLSPRFFYNDTTLMCNRGIRYESTSLNRIVADKSHRVIVA